MDTHFERQEVHLDPVVETRLNLVAYPDTPALTSPSWQLDHHIRQAAWAD